MENTNLNKYIPSFFSPQTREVTAWVLILIGKKLLVKKTQDKVNIPELIDLTGILSEEDIVEYIGKYEGHDCYCKIWEELPELPEYLEFIELMDLTRLSGDPNLFLLVGTANHILHWNSVNQYCGVCGNKMSNKTDERAKLCPNCGHLVYPRISPAVITAIFKGDQILLAHNRNFRNGMYSLIAGYVEPGETLEQCVAREIYEEVGIKVTNIRYFNSQPWPFPDSLMMAFTADYESGEIVIDNREITDAAWYKADNLPDIPSTDSIAGKMIRWYRDKYCNL